MRIVVGLCALVPLTTAGLADDRDRNAAPARGPTVSALPETGSPAPVAVPYPVAAGSALSEGPDVMVSELGAVLQSGRMGDIGAGTVGLAVATTSCNKGDVPINWFAFPFTEHPVIPQNLYRLHHVSGSDRLEQIGQSWMKHSFSATNHEFCGLDCIPPGNATRLGSGCSDTYTASLNGSQCGLGPRSAVNPYTGVMAGGSALPAGGGCSTNTNYPARNHIGHVKSDGTAGHTPIAHRLQVQDVDLLPELNPQARYFAEAQYICQDEYLAGTANQFNNVSYKEVTVTGPSLSGFFDFLPVFPTFVEQPALNAWVGAAQVVIEPAPGTDGRAILAYEVTQLEAAKWHYEYAVYNMNLDRAIGTLSVPVPDGVTLTDIGFHAPLNHAPEANAENYSNEPWIALRSGGALTWSTIPYGVDPASNAVRFGTLYNFRFDADMPPTDVTATVGTYKVVESIGVPCLGPSPIEPPRIIHGGAGTSFDAHAFSGFIDPRGESSDGVNHDRGVSVVTIRFDQPVENLGGGPMTETSFVVRETGDEPPPEITEISTPDALSVAVRLSRPITPQEWTTIEVQVQNLAGVPIANDGDLGVGIVETDRLDVGCLPGDVNQDGLVSPADLIRFRQHLAGLIQTEIGVDADFIDMNRDGSSTPADLILFRQTVAGTGPATRAWVQERMRHAQP